jgi:hypothetical protein
LQISSDPRLRFQIQKSFDEQFTKKEITFGKAGAQFVEHRDDATNYVTALMKMFKEREVKKDDVGY